MKINNFYSITVMLLILLTLACRDPLCTEVRSMPNIDNLKTIISKNNNEFWVEITFESPEFKNWEVEFLNGAPQEYKLLKENSRVSIKWMADKKHIGFFGTKGYRLLLNNPTCSSCKFETFVVLRPTYSLWVEALLRIAR